VLERHPSLDERLDPAIRIVPYCPAWPALADAELRRLAEGLGPVASRLEHVGSTAVPGLVAKPIIDLQLSVEDSASLPAFVEPLERLGYLFAADPASPRLHFFGRPATRPRTHHLHVCSAGSSDELRHLAVRDYLRAHPGEVARYGELKQRVSARHPGDRVAYMQGKDSYVAELEARALRWDGSTSS
jgi:GrpB-like predicted nucleotidyltransferase (UPF0157 family)